jgi:PAS domain-containing protein
MVNRSVPIPVDETTAFLALAEMGRLGVCVLGADGSIARVNSRFCELVGSEAFMLEDRRWEDLRGVPALEAIEVDALGAQRKDTRAVWYRPALPTPEQKSSQPEWLVWRRKTGDLPSRVIIVVRSSDGDTQELKEASFRRRKKSPANSAPQNDTASPGTDNPEYPATDDIALADDTAQL